MICAAFMDTFVGSLSVGEHLVDVSLRAKGRKIAAKLYWFRDRTRICCRTLIPVRDQFVDGLLATSCRNRNLAESAAITPGRQGLLASTDANESSIRHGRRELN
jgi:hypothetical protein